MYWIQIPVKLPNKSNSNSIRFAPRFWLAISGIVDSFRKNGARKIYWLGPSREVKQVEEIIALHFKTQEHRTWTADEHLGIWINLVNQKVDVDGIKAVLDGIEKSGRISNDRQFDEVHIKRLRRPGQQPAVSVCVFNMAAEGEGTDKNAES